MADYQLPIDSQAPHYEVGVTLEGISFLFTVRWNARDAAWYFHVDDSEGSRILSGVKIVLGALLGARCTDARFPSGGFFVADTSGNDLDAGIDDLGTRVIMYYRPAADFEAA